MAVKMITDIGQVDWNQVRDICLENGMADHPVEKRKAAFLGSFRCVFLMEEEELVGFGRLVSDGIYHGALYEVNVRAKFQGKGYGKRVVESLLEGLDEMTVLLFAAKGKEPFYEGLGFYKAPTAMIRPADPAFLRKNGQII